MPRDPSLTVPWCEYCHSWTLIHDDNDEYYDDDDHDDNNDDDKYNDDHVDDDDDKYDNDDDEEETHQKKNRQSVMLSTLTDVIQALFSPSNTSRGLSSSQQNGGPIFP